MGLHHILCSLSLGSGRYLGRPRAEQTVLVRPPFLRPEVSDGQITVKIMDNGIQTELKRTKVRKGGVSTPHVGVLRGARGCKPASVSKEPSEPCHIPPPPCCPVLCPLGIEITSLPCGSDHMRLCILHCPSLSRPSLLQHCLEVSLSTALPSTWGMCCPRALRMLDGPRGTKGPITPLHAPCLLRGGLRLRCPADPLRFVSAVQRKPGGDGEPVC